MYISNYLNFDTINGEGIRCTLWISGCEHNCRGCFNKSAMSFNNGNIYTKEFEEKILKDLDNSYINGLSLLGGEPLHPKNISTVTNLCKKIKEKFPKKDIWCWTGYHLHEVVSNEILEYIDILIDGKYEINNPTNKPFRGSDNQIMWEKTIGWLGDIQWRELK